MRLDKVNRSELGTPLPKGTCYTSEIQPDLAAYVVDMADHNGFLTENYLNGLLEKGIRAELNDEYTEQSVSAFLLHLMTEKKCDFSLLVKNLE